MQDHIRDNNIILEFRFMKSKKNFQFLIVLHSERPKMYTILVFLGATGLTSIGYYMYTTVYLPVAKLRVIKSTARQTVVLSCTILINVDLIDFVIYCAKGWIFLSAV